MDQFSLPTNCIHMGNDLNSLTPKDYSKLVISADTKGLQCTEVIMRSVYCVVCLDHKLQSKTMHNMRASPSRFARNIAKIGVITSL